MKVFISYSTKDGLKKAREAASILSQYGHKPWIYEQHKILGATTFRDISTKIRYWSDVFLYICTPSSLDSRGQQLEVGYALSKRNVKIVPISIDKAEVPPELTAFNYETLESDQFQDGMQVISKHLAKNVERIQRLEEGVRAKLGRSSPQSTFGRTN